MQSANFSVDALPRGNIKRRIESFKQELESELDNRKIVRSVYTALLVQTALRLELRAALIWRWLKSSEGRDLGLMDRTQLLREMTNASTERDKTLQRLGLDKRESSSFWGSLTIPLAESGSDESGESPPHPNPVS